MKEIDENISFLTLNEFKNFPNIFTLLISLKNYIFNDKNNFCQKIIQFEFKNKESIIFFLENEQKSLFLKIQVF